MAANGHIPSSQLGPVPGTNAGLLKAAAMAYTAMHYASVKRYGISLALTDGSVGRTYRSYARQVLAKQTYGSNAATPGSSNHGLGLAVDLMSQSQRTAIDRIGAYYGWAKRCSDASWEWWHIRHNPGCTGARWKPEPPKPDPLRHLGKRQRAASERLLYHRRERRREGKSGKGPRYRRHDKYVDHWRGKVSKMYKRARGDEKRALKKVLNDRNGRL